MPYLFLLLLLLSPPLFAQPLDTLYLQAAEKNRALKASYKSFEAALLQIDQVGQLPDPSFSFGWFILPVETRVGPQRARFSLGQRFPWWGTLAAKEDIASLKAKLNYQDFVQKRQLLYWEIAQAYYPLYRLARYEELERELLEVLQQYKRLAAQRFRAGRGNMSDVLRVDLRINQQKTRLELLPLEQVPLRKELAQLLQSPVDSNFRLPDSLTLLPPPPNRAGDSLAQGQPQWRALEIQQSLSQAEEKLAELQKRPSFSVGLDYVMVGKRPVANIEQNGKDILMPMASIQIPIQQKAQRAAAKAARLNAERYALQAADFLDKWEVDYTAVHWQLQRNWKQLRLYQQQIEALKRIERLLLEEYQQNTTSFEELLRVREQLLDYQKEQVKAQSSYQIAQARLAYLESQQ